MPTEAIMSLASAQEKMRELATKAKTVYEDGTKSVSEKAEELAKIDVDVKSASDEVALHKTAARLMAGGEAAEETKAVDEGVIRAKSVGAQVVESAAFKNFAAGAGQRSASVELKTVNTVNEGTTFSGGFPTGQGGAAVLPDFLPGIVDLRFQQLVIADLFAQGATTSNQISYVKETAFQNLAAGVSEGTAKPQSDDTIARVVEQVGKIAHFMKTTDELIQDAAAYQSFLQNRLVLGVRLKEQDALLNGSGYPSVPGLLGRSGMQTTIASEATGTLADRTLVLDDIYEQITAIRFNAFVEPDAIVANPVDWQNLRLGKDGQKQYFAGGPFTGAYGNGGYSNVDSVWGLRVVITPAIAAGTLLVGGFQECAQLFRRQGITVEMTNSNVDDFQNNLVTTRAEERLALAVYRPGGFGKNTITWA